MRIFKTIMGILLVVHFFNSNAQIDNDFNISPSGSHFFQVQNPNAEINDNSRQLIYPKREFRCAWIATVYNIDYPSNTGLSVNTLKNEFIALLNKLKKSGINAIFVQIRPSCDAFYNSPYEPWSEWLTGTQGVAPASNFDPLVFMIEEAHNRGIEFHAWLNPYRAVVSTGSSSVSSNHISVTQPSWCVTYNSLKILNPGLPQVRDYVTNIVADIVSRYDIQGIHFDDYFYPYPSGGVSFNDNSTFTTYPRGFTNKEDWRRDNVNIFIKRINDTIKTIKPFVKFGVGPFGIWKNGVPSGITGLSSYYEIYCDPVTWLNEQNIDYVSPQLYWKIGTNQDFNTLVDWWGTQASNNQRHCYAGMASYLLNPSGSNWAINDILNQIKSTRLINYKVEGESFFSSTSINDNMKSFADSLQLSQNKYKCLVPTMPWLDSIAPLAPINVTHTLPSTGVNLSWQNPGIASDNDTVKYFVIYRNTTGSVVDITDAQQILYISTTPITSYNDTINVSSFPAVAYAITSCDKLHNESNVEYVNINITPPSNDNCIASQTIIPSVNCTPISGDLVFSSTSGIPKPSCDNFASPSLNDVWYQFIATATEHTIKIVPDGNMDAVLALYNSCNGAEIACADNSGTSDTDSLVASGLTVGTNYLLRVYDYGSIAPSTTTFNICIDGPNLSTDISKEKILFVDLFPNPINDYLLFGNINTNDTEVNISIQDILSRKVLETRVKTENEKFSIQLPHELKSGIYFINIELNNSTITKKIILQ